MNIRFEPTNSDFFDEDFAGHGFNHQSQIKIQNKLLFIFAFHEKNSKINNMP